MATPSRHEAPPAGARVFRPGEYPSWDPSASLVAFERRALFDRIVWHRHAHLELALVLEGGGARGLGAAVEPCEDGDLCLSAAGTPHGCSARRRGGRVRALVVHFSQALTATACSAPELASVRRLLERARAGVVVGGRTRDQVAGEMLKLLHEPRSSFRRPLRLLDALGVMAASDEVRTVAPAADGADADLPRPRRAFAAADHRLREVSRYLDLCGLHEVSQREAAARAGLSASAFSRFFKRALGLTFEDYVNDARLARACRLLAESPRPVIDIAFEVGFNSAAHFNRRFRRAKGMTPTEYRRQRSPCPAPGQ